MSRGHWAYKNEYLKDEIFGWNAKEYTDVFEDHEISSLIFDVFDILYAYDSYCCGDWSEKSYLEEKQKFKKKWFETSRKDRTKNIIDKKLEECKKELYKTYGIEVESEDEV